MKCFLVSIALLATMLVISTVAFYVSSWPEFLGRVFVVQDRIELKNYAPEERDMVHEDSMSQYRADQEKWKVIKEVFTIVGLIAQCIVAVLPLLFCWWFVVYGEFCAGLITDLLYLLIFRIDHIDEQYYREKYNINEDDGSEVNSGSNENDDDK